MGGPHDPIISDGVFAAEVLLLAVSLWSIRFERQEKARIRLAATRPLLSRPSASLGEVDFLAPLSLSNQPPIPNDLSRLMSESNPLGRSSSLPASFPTSPNGFPLRMGGPPEPVFGQTSLSSSQPPPAQYLLGPSEPQDEMEWDPTPSHTPLDDSWIRPQTFFPREEPTGLENLFDGWNWLEDNTSASRGVLRSKAEAMRKDGSGQGSRIWNWLGWK
ncbi:hypothetical protein FRB99_006086 [Tulasnella sp. 403]|nr:hypothetical protein FRB99_006086 [Tulasnella sp. 403]